MPDAPARLRRPCCTQPILQSPGHPQMNPAPHRHMQPMLQSPGHPEKSLLRLTWDHDIQFIRNYTQQILGDGGDGLVCFKVGVIFQEAANDWDSVCEISLCGTRATAWSAPRRVSWGREAGHGLHVCGGGGGLRFNLACFKVGVVSTGHC